ncbi:hypothetical protein LS684_23070 (plasmid) [Cytobacillus spongiae]|uniref:hypothetical protein n=1 Tax=Cytobacillus spongiae TaxID=2901381 RepID=UPI001F3C1FA8|nr:hypothetical protein [Cytobacillus spongiae]UII58474.1 hypothetical protein LS684_23070 [Cytobacillus spongiae]
MEQDFTHHQKERVSLGELYRESIDTYGEKVSIIYCDPRNFLSIFIYFIRQAGRKKLPLHKVAFSILFHIKREAIFINGHFLKEKREYHPAIQKHL